MFEKEAEAYATKHENTKYNTLEWWSKRNTFQKGAEFGYCKANEWHYVKDGLFQKKVRLSFVFVEVIVEHLFVLQHDCI